MNNTPRAPRSRIRRFVRKLGQIVIVIYLLAAVGCATFQRKLIYYPRHESPAALDELAKSRRLERWKNSDGQGIGWKKTSPRQPAQGQLLVTHGNGGCAIDRFDFTNPLAESGAVDVFVLEYPGFGDRAGSPNEKDMCAAADEALQALPRNVPTYILGESIGTGVAAYLAGNHPEKIAGVLLVAPYNCLADVAQHHVKIFPARWILQEHFPSEDYLRNYHGPLAILVGGKDKVVPAKFGRRLFDGYTGPKKLWEVPTGGHESIHDEPPEFWEAVITFWRE